MTAIEKIKILLNQAEIKAEESLTIGQENSLRERNLREFKKLYEKLEISKNHLDFSTIFHYKSINLAGIGLKKEDFGEIREGKYVQIISIAYVLNNEGKEVLKNASLGYYGKAEKLSEEKKSEIIEFVLRWRYEKSFQQSDYYEELLHKLH